MAYFVDVYSVQCSVSAPEFLMRNECLVDLQQVTDIDLLKLTSLEEMKAAADNYDMVKRLEEILMVWHTQIDQVCLPVCLLVWSGTNRTNLE